MGRAPCCDRENVKRGPWSPEEDSTLKSYVAKHGTGGNWIALPQKAGLRRCGKSCRLRWLNYLRPGIKHGGFTEQEDNVICSLYKSIGSRWSVIASHLPGRTDNDVKNYWNTKLKKKLLTAHSNLNYHHNKKKSNNNSNGSKHTCDSTPPSPPTAAVLAVKSEDYGFGSFSMPADNPASSALAPVDAGAFGCFNSHSQVLVPEPASFPVPGLADQSNYGGSANGYVVSPSAQDISAASSCLTTDNGIGWSDNAGGVVDVFLMELGLAGPMDLLTDGGYGLLDRVGDVGSVQVGGSGLWPNAGDNPQELYQGVTYS
ncbi:hypothetical protein Taro_017000 [Colocasia esculenta]|uniref:Uncharacterized protein n=1 Tax=Colocasia esculenta TaxID=4460 RepID=A0A843UY15_COLES|nr:hypothetical protein [Colocasia esculenta]